MVIPIDFSQHLPKVLGIVFTLVFFLAAYILYAILVFVSRRWARKDGMWRKLVEGIRYPCLLIFLEIAALLSFRLLVQAPGPRIIFDRVLTVLFIGTVGWFAAGIVRAFHRNFEAKMARETISANKRSIQTQVLFLYRLLMFAVVMVTIATILMTFPYIRSVGVGILGSAGIAGLAIGIAARPILLNLMAGVQIAMTKMIKIGDAIFVEGEFSRIESIHLTHVVVCTWDWRRMIFPISYFIDKPFQNWDATNPELLGVVFMYCDFMAPVSVIRKKVEELVIHSPFWNKKVWNVHVTNCTEKTMEIRITASADNAPSAFELRAYIREKLIDFLQKEYPQALPSIRNYQLT